LPALVYETTPNAIPVGSSPSPISNESVTVSVVGSMMASELELLQATHSESSAGESAIAVGWWCSWG
jgi:hypothetical protein